MKSGTTRTVLATLISRRTLFRLVAIGFVSVVLINTYRGLVAQRELNGILSQIESVGFYDIQLGEPNDPKALANAISAPFPTDTFKAAAASSQHRWGGPIWKGSVLAVLTLRDGSQRRARISYYGNFFKLEETQGYFALPSSSSFQKDVSTIIDDQFVPQRRRRNLNDVPVLLK